MLYKNLLKHLERFHQRCLRHILKVKWTTYTPDTEVLERARISSVEAIITRHSLRWCGHLVRMEDCRIPKQLFYGEMSRGKRKASKPKQRYKDTLKDNLKKCGIPTQGWEELAADGKQWRKSTHEGVILFERNRVQHALFKRSIRKRELTAAPKAGNRECEICGRLCLSLAGYRSHMRRHEDNGKEMQYPLQVGLTCVKCGKVTKSKAGMKSHQRSHARREEEERNQRCHTRGRVDN